MLIHNGSAGNTIGFDGLFYEGKLLIHPGIHFITFPRKYGELKESFKTYFPNQTAHTTLRSNYPSDLVSTFWISAM